MLITFSVAWEVIKYADMHSKGIHYLYQYEEGHDLDFDIGLYFYEQLCKFVEDPKNSQWAGPEWAKSRPEMMTALKRKQELREKVDVNFDGRVSFLEYLLYQYRDFANPADFCQRSMVPLALLCRLQPHSCRDMMNTLKLERHGSRLKK